MFGNNISQNSTRSRLYFIALVEAAPELGSFLGQHTFDSEEFLLFYDLYVDYVDVIAVSRPTSEE